MRTDHLLGKLSRASLAGIALFCATLLAYFPALQGGFIWDDDGHVTKPALRSLHGLWRIWTELGATQQYYPVLHSAFWIEHRLWGDAPLGYHLLNVLLHATAACLFGLVLARVERVVPNALDRASRPSSALGTTRSTWPLLAAFIFALHPVCVESVAWISEQKNTLSTVFYLLSALAYLHFDQDRKPRAYFLALGLFVLALLSKSVTATLPAALLVIFWWQRGRLSGKRDVVPLLPWFATAAAAGILTAWVERTFIIGAQGYAFDLGPVQRCLLAGRVIWFYFGKLFWPANLIFIYPRWQVDAAAAWQYLFPVAAVASVVALWLIRRRARGPLAGWLFFIGSLFPALGFFNAYPFIFSYVADHFQYLASLGIIATLAGGWQKAGKRESGKSENRSAVSRFLAFPLSRFFPAALLLTLGTLTWRQCGDYKNAETLYRKTLEKNPDCVMAHNNLGKLLRESGRVQEAIGQYLQALRLQPDAKVHYNLGVALDYAGRPRDAVLEYKEALVLNPRYPEAHINLARALAGMGEFPEAIAHDREALRLTPDSAEAHNNLGNIFYGQGRVGEAMEEFQSALRIDPGYATAHNGMGVALARNGRAAEAMDQFQEALRARPDYPEAHVNLALALARKGQVQDAIAHLKEALRLKPDLSQARDALERLKR